MLQNNLQYMPRFMHLEEYRDLYCKSAMETGKLNFFELYSDSCDERHTNTHYK